MGLKNILISVVYCFFLTMAEMPVELHAIENFQPTPHLTVTQFYTKPMERKFSGEQYGQSAYYGPNVRVIYFTPDIQEQMRLHLIDGKIYSSNGELFNTEQTGSAIFVMDGAGNIYAYPHNLSIVIHHSSLISGAPTASSGEMVVRDGVLIYINRLSGHYVHSIGMYEQILTRFKQAGIEPQSSTLIDVKPPEDITAPNFFERMSEFVKHVFRGRQKKSCAETLKDEPAIVQYTAQKE
jgi:hypothetical protein